MSRPTSIERRSADNANDDFMLWINECNQRCPGRNTAHKILSAINRIDDPVVLIVCWCERFILATNAPFSWVILALESPLS